MNKKSALVVTTLLLSVALAGCGGGEVPAAPASVQKAIPVQVAKVTKGSIKDSTGIIGSFTPKETAQVSPKISGKIQSINLTVGQKVSKGDTLFTIDQKDIRDSIKQSQESYQVALANLKQAESGAEQSVQQSESSVDQAKSALVQQDNSITQAQTSLVDAQNSVRDAQNTLNRNQQLFSAGALSQSELEQSQITYRKAQTAVENAQIALHNAQTSKESAQTTYNNAQKSLRLAQQKTGIDVARASVNQAKANLDTARSQLVDAVVKAPISGTISVVTGVQGQMVSAQSAVVTIANTNPIIAKVNVSESELLKMQVGSSVTVGVDSLDKRIEARVSAVNPVMDNDLKAYPVEISVPNGSGELKSGMVVTVYMKTEAPKNILVSQDAITEQAGKKYAYVVEGTVAKRVEVQTGQESAKQVEITKGLTEGQNVVVKGVSLLSDGAKINVVK
ncbi:efflux RND transporter periplasmic adaptor subunit [Paenibacillus sp. EKM102P]|uniref:efflux RND transporter periplasmic adaptor subunit n=1 Tax=Paenibacillus TaxID=44249 RepID=UPI000E3B80FC|nr:MULTISPECIES: efflux RND transporter periplasmic adaptor subunit [Paenibacillus]KAF6621157.1 efflux RND transporter periplasmic adaptor subunit [Paenibacillus sp. EKM101P]KAF6622461.1 efflux RND transporter periplasmic adaptor subunit [Paenibacillus sp. EKM102P]KAF6632310.1 efflux RND transporter periplasmic adaptor subunit [Paenibacillus sp. EKM10P]KAF6647065.1 efflux RND transporter periplasmic adaptor subunit [Paenibacillus sp. EKM11P]RFT99238.1 efflux RND transporter periplasmic adaptor